MSDPLDPQRWQKLTELFDRLVGLAAAERSALLLELCGDDEALRAQAEALLREADVLGVLDDPGAEVLATWLDEIEATARDEALGQRVGPYRLIEELGRGGMGVVYLAERADGQFEQRVALKLVKRGLDTDEVLERFRRERQILARLGHPAIARLFDGGATEDGRPYFAMERVTGQPITVYCDERQLSIEERLKLIQKVCEAVEHAHGHLVVHRDLKPSNILVTAEGDLKLLDFGVAKLLGSGEEGRSTPTLTRTGLRAMTPEYAAPEQVLGNPVSAATDVYALGVVLYELLTGRRAYRLGQRFDAQAERTILEAEPERPSAVVQAPPEGQERTAEELAQARGLSPAALSRRLAGDLDAIVLTALRKEPERRYASVHALAEDIGRHLAGEPVKARPEGWTYRAGKFARRNRAALLVAAALLCLGAVGLVVERGRRAARREVVKQYLAKGMGLAAEGDSLGALPWLARALESEPDAAAREDHRLRIGTLLEYAPRLVWQWAHDGPMVAARFSPDGTRVLTASDDGTARVWNVTSGQALVTLRHETRLSTAAFSPDGRQVLTAGADGKVRLWDASTGTPVRSLEGHERGVTFAQFSPNGRRIVAGGPGGTRLWDPTSSTSLLADFPGADLGGTDPVFDDRGRLFLTSSGKEARIWDAETGGPLGPPLRPAGGSTWGGAFVSPDGDSVVASPVDGRCAMVLDAGSGRQRAKLCHGSPTSGIGFGTTGRKVFVFTGPSANLWDLSEPPRLVTSFEHPDVLLWGELREERLLLTSTRVGAFVWDLSGVRRIGPLPHSAPVRRFDLDDSERYLLTASEDGTARLWDLAGVEFTSPAASFPVSTRGGAISRDGKRILMVLGAYQNATHSFQQLYDAPSGEPVVPPLRHAGAIAYVGALPELFSPDERRVVSGGADGKLRVWSAESGEPLLTLSLADEITGVAFSPDGKRIATGEQPSARPSPGARRSEGSARLWDAATGLPVGLAMTGIAPPVAVAFSPDGRRLATCGDGAAALWDATSGRPLVPSWRVDGLAGGGYTCRFSPDARWLMTGGNTVHLWDAVSGKAAPATFPGYGGSFSPTGDRLAAFLGETAVVVCSAASGRALTPPHKLQGAFVTSAHFSSHGRWVVGGAEDLHVWDAASGIPVTVLDRRSWTTGGNLKGAFFLPSNDGILSGELRFEGIARMWIWRFARDRRPVADLIELASLLAGYRVVSETSGSVPLTGKELRRAWDRQGQGRPEAAVVSAEKVVAWHRRLGEELAEEKRFAEALPHFDAAIQQGPPRATVFERRGHARAELGRLEDAEADFRRAAQLRPGFPDLWSHAALLRLARGDGASQRRICSDLLLGSGTTQNPDRAYWIARTCALVPDALAAEWELVVHLAELALPLSGADAELLDLRGAALHRAGRYEEARERLLAAVKARGRVTPWEAAFLAMVHYRLQRPQEGRSWLKRGVGPPAAAENVMGDEGPAWTERLEAAALLAEARALLGVR